MRRAAPNHIMAAGIGVLVYAQFCLLPLRLNQFRVAYHTPHRQPSGSRLLTETRDMARGQSPSMGRLQYPVLKSDLRGIIILKWHHPQIRSDRIPTFLPVSTIQVAFPYVFVLSPHLSSARTRPLLLPFLRRMAFRRPGVDRSNLLLQRRIDQPMPRQRSLLDELRRHNDGFVHLAAATCSPIQPKKGECLSCSLSCNLPLISTIST